MNLITDLVCLLLFFLLIALPSLYGFHLYLLMFLAQRRRRRVRLAQQAEIRQFHASATAESWPRVTTQLPIYNELAVARRVIEAAAHMDYPRDRHEVQVLDDSTDATRAVVDQVAAELRAQGYRVHVVRRPDRTHYKAGALAHGLAQAAGEFIAIFDADFVPDPGFLRRMIPLIAPHPDVCVVQGRWGHLNSEENWLTETLALSLDLHFAIEQGARNWNGLLMSFNGTGGIWRRAAIDDPRVGGWSGDTITEDLDLSYRAQMAGWRMRFCIDEVCPAEVPSNVDALKTQQRRWATGTIQTARKLLPRVWACPTISLAQKLEATVHMTQYAIALPMVVVALVGRLLPLMLTTDVWPIWIQYLCASFLLAALAPCVAYMNARYAIGGGIPGPGRILKLIMLGLGLCLNNAVAVLMGLHQRGGEFVRTPKTGSAAGNASGSMYASIRSRLWIFEIILGLYCLAQWLIFLPIDGYLGGLFLLLYAIGLLVMGWSSRPWSARRPQVRLLPSAVVGPASHSRRTAAQANALVSPTPLTE